MNRNGKHPGRGTFGAPFPVARYNQQTVPGLFGIAARNNAAAAHNAILHRVANAAGLRQARLAVVGGAPVLRPPFDSSEGAINDRRLAAIAIRHARGGFANNNVPYGPLTVEQTNRVYRNRQLALTRRRTGGQWRQSDAGLIPWWRIAHTFTHVPNRGGVPWFGHNTYRPAAPNPWIDRMRENEANRQADIALEEVSRRDNRLAMDQNMHRNAFRRIVLPELVPVARQRQMEFNLYNDVARRFQARFRSYQSRKRHGFFRGLRNVIEPDYYEEPDHHPDPGGYDDYVPPPPIAMQPVVNAYRPRPRKRLTMRQFYLDNIANRVRLSRRPSKYRRR